MIRQFDVVRNPDAHDATYKPYFVVLQSDIVSGLHSTIVAPLVTKQDLIGASRLNPSVALDDREYWLAMHELFAIERRLLRSKVASLSDHRDAIIAALDFVFTGY